MVAPLHGLRVIDLSQDFAGPFCSMILSDLGAEVVKVEKPGTGDETRAWGPPFVGDLSYYFLSLNRGKRSITLNLKSPVGQRIVRELARDSDVFLESSRPGTLAKYSLDYLSLRRVNKAIVYCSISGFGQTGPYKDRPSYDIVALAMSGIMRLTGEEGRPPIRVCVPVADIAAGHYASTAILASLSKRLITGIGDYIDVSLVDSIVSWLSYNATRYFANGKQPPRMGSAHPSIVPYQSFRCSDRDLVVAVGNERQWRDLCECLGREDLEADRRFATNPVRVKNRRILVPILSRIFRTRTAHYWQELLLRNSVPTSTVFDIREVTRDPHLRSRGMIVESLPLSSIAFPVRFRAARPNRILPAPRLGEHTQPILKNLGYTDSTIRQFRTSGTLTAP